MKKVSNEAVPRGSTRANRITSAGKTLCPASLKNEIPWIVYLMRIVIFGCGYVGRQLAGEAVKAGHEVWVHSRNGEALSAVEVVDPRRRIAADLHSDTWHNQLVGDWDVVFNLVSSAGGGLQGYETSYIDGNRSIRHWATEHRVGRFIYTSATSVYPQSAGEWVAEDDVPMADALSPSGRLLRQAELETLSNDCFESCCIARLAGIYGPGRHLYLNALREGASEIPGDGNAWLNLVHRDDIVRVLLEVAKAPLRDSLNVFNVVDDEPARKQAIVDWLAQQLGCSSIPFNPEASSQRASKRTSSSGLPNRRIRNDRLKHLIDWQPLYPSYREGYGSILRDL